MNTLPANTALHSEALTLWRVSYPSYVGIWAFDDIDSYTTLSFQSNLFQSALTPQSHNSPVQHSTRHTGQDSAKVIKPHLSVGRVHKLQIYPISALMPGSHHYDSGCLTEPPAVTRSSSRTHYKWCNSLMILSLIMLFVSASHNFGCNRLQFSQQEQIFFFTENNFAIHIFCGWFGSLFPSCLIGIVIETLLKQLSDENHLDFITHLWTSVFFFFFPPRHILPPTLGMITGPFNITSSVEHVCYKAFQNVHQEHCSNRFANIASEEWKSHHA